MAGFTGDRFPSREDDPPHSAAVRCIVDWYGPTVISEMAYEPSSCSHTDADDPEGWLIGHLPVQEHPDLAAATIPHSYLSKHIPPNINYLDTDEACMKEVEDNFGTLKRAWEWAAQKGLIILTWHWISPLGGRSKAFYTVNTDFDASRAVMEGTPEYKALLSDMDMMAALLKPFCRAGIPILWRPFYEGEGGEPRGRRCCRSCGASCMTAM